MKINAILLAGTLAIGLSLLATEANAFTVYKIDIEKSFIKASADDDVIKLTMVGKTLTVGTVPANGFYGLKAGDQITKVNSIDIHGTDGFVSALDNSTKGIATFQLLRDGRELSLSIPKKGYSWFQ